jgi:hypothetical protein
VMLVRCIAMQEGSGSCDWSRAGVPDDCGT